MKRLLTLGALGLLLIAPAVTSSAAGPPDATYKKVSTLVALPDFIPGMGTLYVKPSTLPIGPFLAYDRNDTLVATIYMVPLKDMNNRQNFSDLAVGSNRVEQVDINFNPGHAGVETPHYHVTIWHVKPDTAKLK